MNLSAPGSAPCWQCGFLYTGTSCNLCKAPREIQYRAPIENVCPSCGAKHTGFFQECVSCANQQE